jgi:hypothetical protein
MGTSMRWVDGGVGGSMDKWVDGVLRDKMMH